MAGIKISELSEACSINGDELIPIVQNSCTKFVKASELGSDGTITSITAGCGLAGGGSCCSVNIEIDNNCFAAWNDTATTVEAFSGNWESTYSTVEGLSSNWDQSGCAGLTCIGDITGVTAGSGITGGGSTGSISIALDAVCESAWNGTTTTVAANSATWVRTSGNQTIGGDKCFTGNILSAGVDLDQLFGTGGGGGGGITGFDSGGDGISIDESDPAGVVVEVDSTVVRTSGNQTIVGNKCFNGNILSAGVNIDQLFGTGGSSFASITDDGTTVCIDTETRIIGNVVFGGVGDGHSLSNAENSALVGGGDNTIAFCANRSGLLAGESNTVNASDGAVIAGVTNCVKHHCSVIAGGTNITSVSANMLHAERLYVKDLPETDPGLSGVVYQSNGTVKVSDDNVTVADVAGTNSTFGSSVLFFSVNDVTYGPVAGSVQGNYYKPSTASTDELSVAFYSDAAEIEIKIERSQSSLQVFIDDEPVHEYAVAGYQNRLLKLSHSEAKVRKYELRGKSYGFGGVYTNTAVNEYQVWPYERRKERPLLLVMTDSYGTAFNTTYGLSFAEKLAEYLDMDLHSDALNSSGWSSTGSSSPSTRSASHVLLTRDPDVILTCLGYNDKSSPNQTNIEAGINAWHTSVTGTFTSAKIMLASPWTPVGVETNLTTVSGYIQGRATALGADFIDINGVVTANNKAVYTSNDNTHPSLAGHEYLARRLEALMLRTGNVPTRD